MNVDDLDVCPHNGKVCYVTHKQAVTILNWLRRNRHNKRESRPVRAYKCQHCERWHLTSMPEYSGK